MTLTPYSNDQPERIYEQVAINPKYSRLPVINHVVTIQHH